MQIVIPLIVITSAILPLRISSKRLKNVRNTEKLYPTFHQRIKMVKVMVFIVYVPREFAAIKHIDWILKLSRLRLNDEWGAILFLKYI